MDMEKHMVTKLKLAQVSSPLANKLMFISLSLTLLSMNLKGPPFTVLIEGMITDFSLNEESQRKYADFLAEKKQARSAEASSSQSSQIGGGVQLLTLQFWPASLVLHPSLPIAVSLSFHHCTAHDFAISCLVRREAVWTGSFFLQSSERSPPLPSKPLTKR